MKFDLNQRKLYLLSAAMLVATLAVVLVLGAIAKPESAAGGAAAPPEQGAAETILETVSPQPSETPAGRKQGTIRTVVYYRDNYGYLVPVTRSIPAEDGVAKATLSLMVAGAYNDMEAARLGLRTVLPEGTSIDLDLAKDGTARIDLGKQVLNVRDAQTEAAMVSAVVQTLTEFPSVKKVDFLVDGKRRERLTFGTEVSGSFSRGSVNLESGDSRVSAEEAKTVSLYFPGEASSLIVPVTRAVYGAGDIETAVLELVKGPGGESPLDRALPAGCGLISVSLKDGVATVNFTKEFMDIAQDSDGGRMAMRALMLTCTQFAGVKKVEVQVEGQPYDPGRETLAAPSFVNDAAALTEEYLRTQTAVLME